MKDTRIPQMAALIDDARVICAEMLEECIPTEHQARLQLTSVRLRLNDVLKSLNRIGDEAS